MKPFMAFFCLVLLSACGSTSGPTSPLTGSWAANLSVRGSSLAFVLGQSGTYVTGTGEYSLEAGRSGTLSVTGDFTDPAFTLSLAYDSGTTATYRGTVGGDQLVGSIQYAGEPPAPLTFTRH